MDEDNNFIYFLSDPHEYFIVERDETVWIVDVDCDTIEEDEDEWDMDFTDRATVTRIRKVED